MISILFF
ncbi:hypothetical protein ACTFIT_002908 [Dictyostelium discoideum]